MIPRVSLFLFLVLAVVVFAGCQTAQRSKIYTCPSCKTIVPATATKCPNCGQKLMAVGSSRQPGAGAPGRVAQAPGAGPRMKFPPVKVGALLEITDSNHQRIAPFLSVEVFKIEQAQDDPVIAFDVGVAEDAILASVGVRGFIPEAPYLGGFFFIMEDFRRTIKPRLYGPHKPHFCTGIGFTIGGF